MSEKIITITPPALQADWPFETPWSKEHGLCVAYITGDATDDFIENTGFNDTERYTIIWPADLLTLQELPVQWYYKHTVNTFNLVFEVDVLVNGVSINGGPRYVKVLVSTPWKWGGLIYRDLDIQKAQLDGGGELRITTIKQDGVPGGGEEPELED